MSRKRGTSALDLLVFAIVVWIMIYPFRMAYKILRYYWIRYKRRRREVNKDVKYRLKHVWMNKKKAERAYNNKITTSNYDK